MSREQQPSPLQIILDQLETPDTDHLTRTLGNCVESFGTSNPTFYAAANGVLAKIQQSPPTIKQLELASFAHILFQQGYLNPETVRMKPAATSQGSNLHEFLSNSASVIYGPIHFALTQPRQYLDQLNRIDEPDTVDVAWAMLAQARQVADTVVHAATHYAVELFRTARVRTAPYVSSFFRPPASQPAAGAAFRQQTATAPQNTISQSQRH